MEYFDYESTAREAGISKDQLAQIVAMMQNEFAHDLMMCELHVLRACMAVRDGQAALEHILGMGAVAQP